MTILGAIGDFYEEQEYKGNSKGTLTFYRQHFDHFLRDTGIVELSEFSEATIRQWLIGHKELSRTTLATYDRALRVFANWLYRRGYVEQNPMVNLPKPKKRHTEIVVFTEAEVRGMLAATKAQQFPRRNAALVSLLLDTGIRAGEAAGLKLHNIHWNDGWLLVDGKSGERTVPFGRRSKLSLRRYVDQERRADNPRTRELFVTRQGGAMVTGTITQLIVRIARSINVQASKVGPHTFRHTFALEFIRAGGDAFTLQRILGHTTLDMTRRYVHLANTDLRAAHKRYAPGDRML